VGRGVPQSRTAATQELSFLQSVFPGCWSLGWSARGQQQRVSSSLIFMFPIAAESLQVKPVIALESPVQKTRGFVVQIALPQRLLERVQQVFGEIT
jgi:hypothetical protein